MPFSRRVGEPIEPLEPRAVAEMEARHRIDRQAAAVRARAGNTRRRRAAAAPASARAAPAAATSPGVEPGKRGAVLRRRAPCEFSVFALAVEPVGEIRRRRQRDEGREPRILARDLLDHLLDQEIAERHAGKPALAVGDRIEHRGRRLVRLDRLALAPTGSARSRREFRGSARPRRRSAARRPAPDGRRRSSAGPADRCGGADRPSCGCWCTAS